MLFSATAAAAAFTAAGSYIEGALSIISVADGILIVPNKMIMNCRVGLRAPSRTSQHAPAGLPGSLLLLRAQALRHAHGHGEQPQV